MIDSKDLISILVFACSACVLWYAFFWLYRDYSVESFRNKMFELRDSFFDEANSGLIDFDHQAYGLLRSTMNGFIRFGHQITFFEVIVGFFCLRGIVPAHSFANKWDSALSDLPSETIKRLTQYREDMGKLVLIHMLKSSPFFVAVVILPAFVITVPLIFMSVLHQRLKNTVSQKLKYLCEGVMRPSLESTALAYGKAA